MAKFNYTAEFNYQATVADSVGRRDSNEVGNVSETLVANSIEEAWQIAEQISQRYAARGKVLRNEKITEAAQQADAGAAAPQLAEATAPIQPLLRCARCGEMGVAGPYPFSTLPSSGLCDDCL